METIIDTIIKIAQGLLTLLSLLLLFIKPFRSWFLNLQDRKRQEATKDESRDEALRCSLRNIITQFYYSHYSICEIHQYEYENIERVYAAYKRMGGNSFVDKLWEEIQEWSVIP